MVRVKTKTTGGQGWKAHRAQQMRRLRDMPKEVKIGFAGNKFIAMVAYRLEYGDSRTNLPERPAFRVGARDIEAEMAGKLKALGTVPKRRDVENVAIWARDRLRAAYLNFHGAGLSERQQARKAGTQYADDELVGPHGPKLINHIHAYVDRQQV